MNEIQLNAVDLNLLKVFNALLETGSTVGAANRLGLTQSAVSHALSRLRHLFSHKLFVREHGGLTATPFAREVAPRIRALLVQATQIVHLGHDFDPATSTRTFALAMPDYAMLTVLPNLRNALVGGGPGIGLEIHQTDGLKVMETLDRGVVSMAIANIPIASADIETIPLFEDSLLVAAADAHPIWNGSLTLSAYLAQDHLDVVRNPAEPGLTDSALAAHDATRSIKLKVDTFLVVPQLVASSGLVATEPSRVLSQFSDTLGYRTEAPPFKSPRFTISLAIHKRISGDLGYEWLADQVIALFQPGISRSQ